MLELCITIITVCIDEEVPMNLSMTIIFCLNSHGNIIKLNQNRWYGECDEVAVVPWSYVGHNIINYSALSEKII